MCACEISLSLSVFLISRPFLSTKYQQVVDQLLSLGENMPLWWRCRTRAHIIWVRCSLWPRANKSLSLLFALAPRTFGHLPTPKGNARIKSICDSELLGYCVDLGLNKKQRKKKKRKKQKNASSRVFPLVSSPPHVINQPLCLSWGQFAIPSCCSSGALAQHLPTGPCNFSP